MTPVIQELPGNAETFRVKERPAFVILPASMPSGAIPWVLYAPTLPDYPGAAERWMFEKFLAAGLAIAGVDVGESYGNPEGRFLYSAFHDELVSHLGFSQEACLLARSRGGLMLYNWAVEHPSWIACIGGIYPVCDLSSYPGLRIASAAYGLSEEELRARLPEHNPVERLEPLARARVPIFHIHGDVDELVPLEKNSGEVKRRYRELGGEMTLMVPRGQGHNMWQGFFQCRELVDFIISHRGQAFSRTGASRGQG